ncbi:MAG: hypothetical protein [Microviridae sp.]|nr:MAG: hypothetical protein [Microviridae sp.]
MANTKKFRTYFYKPETPKESNKLPSETKPSKSLSLKELIARDLKGLIEPSHSATPFYDEEFVVPDFKKMDIVDIEIWKQDLDNRVVEVKKEIEYEKAERKRLDDEKTRLKAKEERRLAKSAQSVPASSGTAS